MSESISNATSVASLTQGIDLGEGNSVQLMFAKLQLLLSESCKKKAMAHMDEITANQAESKLVANYIAEFQSAKLNATGIPLSTMSDDGRKFMCEHGIKMDEVGTNVDLTFKDPNTGQQVTKKVGDLSHNKDQWDVNIASMKAYQEELGSKTQQIMVFIQDFMGQYNSYLSGANSAVQSSNQTLQSLATGR
jgi:hypothetical protein